MFTRPVITGSRGFSTFPLSPGAEATVNTLVTESIQNAVDGNRSAKIDSSARYIPEK